MVNLEIKRYERKESTLVNEGTLATFLTKKGSFDITESSLRGKTKEDGSLTRVWLIINQGDGKGTGVLSCSKALSDAIRAGQFKGKKGALLGLPIYQDEEGANIPFLGMPEGNVGAAISVKVSDVKVEPFNASGPMSSEMLEALLA